MSTQLTLSEAAKILNVSEKSVRRYIKAGRMRANLIKGQKGYEYRIDAKQLKVLDKPPRGRNSHKKVSKHINKKARKQKSKKTKKQENKKAFTKKLSVKPLESVGEIIKKKIKERNIPIVQSQGSDTNLVDYKTLYENLLAKYEQTLLMLGSLETQVLNRSNSSNGTKMEKMEDSIAKQEEIIMDLYQTIQLYKNENNY